MIQVSEIVYPVLFETTLPIGVNKRSLIKCSSTSRCTTQTSDFLFFNWEFVVVCYFFINSDRLFGINNYFLLWFYGNDFRITVWLKINQYDIRYFDEEWIKKFILKILKSWMSHFNRRWTSKISCSKLQSWLQ